MKQICRTKSLSSHTIPLRRILGGFRKKLRRLSVNLRHASTVLPPSVCPYGTHRLQPHKYSWNSSFWRFYSNLSSHFDFGDCRTKIGDTSHEDSRSFMVISRHD